MNIATGFDRIVTRSISDQLYDILRERILSGELRAGEPIRQDAIAALFDVSKIPVREALARLQQDGFVSVHAKRGFFVAPLTRAEAEDVFRLRLRIEPEAASLGARHADAQDKAEARKALEDLEAAIERKDAQRGVYNSRFHLALVRPGAGPATLHVVDLLNVTADRYVRLHLHMQGRDTRANEEHRALLECWLRGGGAPLEKLMARHIQTTLDDLREAL